MHEPFRKSRLLKESPRIRERRWIMEESSSTVRGERKVSW